MSNWSGLFVQQRVLVLLDDLNYKHSHSLFFSSLQTRGYSLDFKRLDGKALQLRDWDDWLYEHVILLASATAPGGAVNAVSLAEFVDSGRNVLVVVDPKVSDEIREFVSECGVDLEAPGTFVTDHFSYVVSGEPDHTLLAASHLVDAPAVFGSQQVTDPVLFRGVGMSISPESQLVTKLLSADNTSLSQVPYKSLADSGLLAGIDIGLVAIMQARNNARVAVAGSIEMFSNRFFRTHIETGQGSRHPKTGNAQFCGSLARWVFQEVGVLRAANLRHHHVGSSEQQPEVYRIKDQLQFSLDIQELTLGGWRPYRADDVQLEFVMLDPYIRTTLEHNKKGTFFTTFTVPDVYGIFKFVIDYRHLGYSYLELSQQIPVRPFKHNEYERFLPAAYPYYSSVFSVMAGFFLLLSLVLYHK
ncbi:hypothetical protein WJX72_005178 [[Myrmecia] bisecta]|uniref:Dolichyl-diphosphooligosaccharide--protein glycosyltransferase 48 kDa subunit n=1 Tax=[Myrmecia] bisecta TaxID=41462 RepID=A0AAW1PTM9_9CHLO